jgi:hypothetical protein
METGIQISQNLRATLPSPSIVGIGLQTFTGEFALAGVQAASIPAGKFTVGFGTGKYLGASPGNAIASGFGAFIGLSIPIPLRFPFLGTPNNLPPA